MKLAERMISLWRAIPNICLHPLYPEQGKWWSFQRDRRIIAEQRAKSKIYILTDDDMEPLFYFNKAVNTMREHPYFGILSAYPEPATINRWTPEDFTPFEDENVMEHTDVGGLRFIRKGAMGYWPEQTRVGYDREHCEAMRSNGFQVGYFKNLKAIHHGEGKSDLWSLSQKASAQ